MPKRRYGLIDRWFSLGERRSTLEHILADEFSWAGPIVAANHPVESSKKYGAAKFSASPTDWQGDVKDWAEQASLVVLVADTTEGVKWELDALGAWGYGAKTLVLVSPNFGDRGRQRRTSRNTMFAILKTWQEDVGQDADTKPDGELRNCFAIHKPFCPDQTIFQSDQIDAFSYRLALRWALRAGASDTALA